MNILSIPSTCSPLVVRPALCETPMMVPIVSNMSMKRKVRTTTSMSQVKIWENWNLQKMGPMLSGSDMNMAFPVSGLRTRLVTASPVAGSLITSPRIAERRIPMRMPPLTFSMTRPPVITRPMIPTRALPLVSSPRVTRVESESTMIPAFWSPMKAMKRPIPAPIAFLSVPGMASRRRVLILVTVMMMNRIPSMKTAVRANCQLYPIVRHTVKTKNAFRPIPGARANGFFA